MQLISQVVSSGMTSCIKAVSLLIPPVWHRPPQGPLGIVTFLDQVHLPSKGFPDDDSICVSSEFVILLSMLIAPCTPFRRCSHDIDCDRGWRFLFFLSPLWWTGSQHRDPTVSGARYTFL